MKLTKKKVLENGIIIIVLLLFLDVYLITQNANILFGLNLILIGSIIVKSKISFFTIKTIILNYILSPIFFQYNYGESYGILNVSNFELYYFEINLILIIYNCISYFFLINTDILIKEKKLLIHKIEDSRLFGNICGILAIVFAIISLPYMPFQSFSETTRFNALLPGDAWNHFVIVLLIFAYPNLKKNRFVQFSYLFVIFWFLSHYERVDVIGLLVLTAILLISSMEKLNIRKLIRYTIIGLAAVVVMLYIGEVRIDQVGNINIFKKILQQNTASDLGYVYNVSIDYSKNEKLYMGQTYLTYLVEAIPLLHSDTRVEKILQDKYNTPGGSYLLSEPLINFGIIGIIVYSIAEICVIYVLITNPNNFKFYIYCFILATLFRSCWYGLNYIEMGLLYFIPALYIFRKLVYKYRGEKCTV